MKNNDEKAPAQSAAVEQEPEIDWAARRDAVHAELRALPWQPPISMDQVASDITAAVAAAPARIAEQPNAEEQAHTAFNPRTDLKVGSAFLPGTLADQLNGELWDNFIAEDALAQPPTRTLQ